MNVVSAAGLRRLIAGKPDLVAKEAIRWYKIARAAQWESLLDVRKIYPSADQVGNVVIFNIRHNRYRLIVRSAFPFQHLYVKALLTHKEYDLGQWKKWT